MFWFWKREIYWRENRRWFGFDEGAEWIEKGWGFNI